MIWKWNRVGTRSVRQIKTACFATRNTSERHSGHFQAFRSSDSKQLTIPSAKRLYIQGYSKRQLPHNLKVCTESCSWNIRFQISYNVWFSSSHYPKEGQKGRSQAQEACNAPKVHRHGSHGHQNSGRAKWFLQTGHQQVHRGTLQGTPYNFFIIMHF